MDPKYAHMTAPQLQAEANRIHQDLSRGIIINDASTRNSLTRINFALMSRYAGVQPIIGQLPQPSHYATMRPAQLDRYEHHIKRNLHLMRNNKSLDPQLVKREYLAAHPHLQAIREAQQEIQKAEPPEFKAARADIAQMQAEDARIRGGMAPHWMNDDILFDPNH